MSRRSKKEQRARFKRNLDELYGRETTETAATQAASLVTPPPPYVAVPMSLGNYTNNKGSHGGQQLFSDAVAVVGTMNTETNRNGAYDKNSPTKAPAGVAGINNPTRIRNVDPTRDDDGRFFSAGDTGNATKRRKTVTMPSTVDRACKSERYSSMLTDAPSVRDPFGKAEKRRNNTQKKMGKPTLKTFADLVRAKAKRNDKTTTKSLKIDPTRNYDGRSPIAGVNGKATTARKDADTTFAAVRVADTRATTVERASQSGRHGHLFTGNPLDFDSGKTEWRRSVVPKTGESTLKRTVERKNPLLLNDKRTDKGTASLIIDQTPDYDPSTFAGASSHGKAAKRRKNADMTFAAVGGAEPIDRAAASERYSSLVTAEPRAFSVDNAEWSRHDAQETGESTLRGTVERTDTAVATLERNNTPLRFGPTVQGVRPYPFFTGEPSGARKGKTDKSREATESVKKTPEAVVINESLSTVVQTLKVGRFNVTGVPFNGEKGTDYWGCNDAGSIDSKNTLEATVGMDDVSRTVNQTSKDGRHPIFASVPSVGDTGKTKSVRKNSDQGDETSEAIVGLDGDASIPTIEDGPYPIVAGVPSVSSEFFFEKMGHLHENEGVTFGWTSKPTSHRKHLGRVYFDSCSFQNQEDAKVDFGVGDVIRIYDADDKAWMEYRVISLFQALRSWSGRGYSATMEESNAIQLQKRGPSS
jgi:hypothetical protein